MRAVCCSTSVDFSSVDLVKGVKLRIPEPSFSLVGGKQLIGIAIGSNFLLASPLAYGQILGRVSRSVKKWSEWIALGEDSSILYGPCSA